MFNSFELHWLHDIKGVPHQTTNAWSLHCKLSMEISGNTLKKLLDHFFHMYRTSMVMVTNTYQWIFKWIEVKCHSDNGIHIWILFFFKLNYAEYIILFLPLNCMEHSVKLEQILPSLSLWGKYQQINSAKHI